MTLKFYQTSRLNGSLDKNFYLVSKNISDPTIDPLFSWFGDLIYVNRRKTILLANELTRFTFLIPEYSNQKTFFPELFSRYLSYAFYFNDLLPEPYLECFSEIEINSTSDKSTLSHLSRLKEEYSEDMNTRSKELNFEKFLKHYDIVLNERPTTSKNTKGYFYFKRIRNQVFAVVPNILSFTHSIIAQQCL